MLTDQGGPFELAFDIGGTEIKLVAARRYDILRDMVAQTPRDATPEQVVQLMEDMAVLLVGDIHETRDNLTGVSVAVAGPTDYRTGMVFETPNIWAARNVPFRDLVQVRFDANIVVVNDADAAAIGEYRFGAGFAYERPVKNMVFVTLSSGVGGGIIIDRKIYTGGGRAGELGHMVLNLSEPICNCGKRGHWEGISSGAAIARMAKDAVNARYPDMLAYLQRAGLKAFDANHVFTAALELDDNKQPIVPTARDIADYASRGIGVAIANIFTIFDPDLMVLGGSVSLRWEEFIRGIAIAEARAYMMENLGEVFDDKRVVLGTLGKNNGTIGALSLLEEPA